MYALVRKVENGYIVEMFESLDVDDGDVLVGEYIATSHYDLSSIIRDHMNEKEND